MCDPRVEAHEEDMARYDYINELIAEHEDGNDADMMDLPPEQEGVTWERIEYPEGAAFVEDRTPPDDEVPF